MMQLGMAVAMFGIIFLADIVWTWWTRACNSDKVAQAAVASVIIYLLGGVSIMAYTEHPWLLIPAAAGAACGTIAGMKWL